METEPEPEPSRGRAASVDEELDYDMKTEQTHAAPAVGERSESPSPARLACLFSPDCMDDEVFLVPTPCPDSKTSERSVAELSKSGINGACASSEAKNLIDKQPVRSEPETVDDMNSTWQATNSSAAHEASKTSEYVEGDEKNPAEKKEVGPIETTSAAEESTVSFAATDNVKNRICSDEVNHTPNLPEDLAHEQQFEFSSQGAVIQDSQQGELLLHRLQLVQQRQGEVFEPRVAKEDTEDGEKADTTNGYDSPACPSSRQTSGAVEGSLLPPAHSSSDDDQSDSGVSADFSPCSAQELQAATVAAAAKHQHLPLDLELKAKGQKDLTQQRPRGCRDGQTVAEVYRTRCLQKTDKSQEALNRQGRACGDYSRGSVQQFRERKQMFEAFQQGRPVKVKPQVTQMGFLSYSKSTTSLASASLCLTFPCISVLERTRSLDLHRQAPETQAAWFNSNRTGPSDQLDSQTMADGTERKRIVLDGDVTLVVAQVYRKRSLRPSLSTGCLFTRLTNEEEEPKRRGDEEDENDEEEEGSALYRGNPFCKLRPSLALRPDVAREIREARERERELRQLRMGLYGDDRAWKHSCGSTNTPNTQTEAVPSKTDQQSRGKLELIWPPPSSENVKQPSETQELRPPKLASQRSALWQRWETGMVNGCGEEED
ncbi:uncharacterized protein LOC114793333 isoform X2 [Denticeps clupeoides]|nr:uncharacterized protein LOC114793333 isoform X2 [Denticeps clupeoides]